MSSSSPKKPGKNSKGADSTVDTIAPIAEWFTIDNVEQLNAIASVRRQRILAEFADQARTTKQVAERLGEPPTRLYHHVEALVEHGFLVLDREAPKRGTIEKYYRAAARRFRVAENCLSDKPNQDEHSRIVSRMLEVARIRILDSLAEHARTGETLTTTTLASQVPATEDEIDSLTEDLLQQLERSTHKLVAGKKKRKRGTRNYQVMILVFPIEDEDELT